VTLIQMISAVEPDNDEGMEQVETDSWNNEQVDGGKVRRVVTQEGSPFLAGWPPSWGDRWLFTPDTVPADLIDCRDGALVSPLEVRSATGRPLTLADIRLKRRRRSEDG
jgi:hypothetical protein